MNTDLFTRAAERVAAFRCPLIVTHAKPDGDAIGATIAMQRWLSERGQRPTALLLDPVPDRYQFMTALGSITILDDKAFTETTAAADGVVVLDTCALGQLAQIADWLRDKPAPTVVFDHHITRDSISDLQVIDETASATCLILLDWATDQGYAIDDSTATALFVGIATDTGWFRHSNTDARTHEAAARLVALGARPHELYEQLYQQDSVGRFRLRAAANQRIELFARERLAVVTLPAALFEECGAALFDTEDLVNEPLQIGTVAVSIMLVEQGGGVVRAGFRSKPPLRSDRPDIDVAELAAHFGGGGHRRAAGARLSGSLDEVRRAVVQQAEQAMDR